MMIFAEDVVRVAEGELGYHEKASNKNLDDKTANSGSGNWQKYGRDLNAAGYYNGNKNGYEWCDQFVDWCFYQACGKSKTLAEKLECQTGNLGAGCKYSMYYYQNAGRFDKSPRVGDQIFFRYSGSTGCDHTGLVVEVTDKLVTTIEGNSNDRVQRRTYSRSYAAIIGYGHPWYDEEPDSAENSQNKVGKTENSQKKEIKTVNITLPVLRSGDKGAEVKTVQRLLRSMGYKNALRGEIIVDGEFGSNTKFAVIAFQVAKGGKGDGIVGEWTWSKLLKG